MRPEGWVIVLMARGMRVQYAVCHDTWLGADIYFVSKELRVS